MIPKQCKRLAEVEFPIAVVSKHAAREKSIRHGHPSTLHLWWARRPLASCRAVLLALLLPDPCDSACPEDFRKRARDLLPKTSGPVGDGDLELRAKLLKFIGDFANWDNAGKAAYLEVGRGLVRAAHGEELPLVVDPFAGGGSIPLEALRLGCEAFASDLNPVACLILKVMLEDIPRHGPGLAEELRKVGGEIKRAAERELADLYPKDRDRAMPIAYLWARTVRCEAPNCGAEIPLMRSFWLCKKPKRKRALRPNVVRPKGKLPCVEFEVFEPKSDGDVRGGTVTRAKAACLCCGIVLPPEWVRAQLSEQRGGADVIFDGKGKRIGGARMTAVVTLKPGETGRHYRLPTDADYAAVRKAQTRLAEILDEWERVLSAATSAAQAGLSACDAQAGLSAAAQAGGKQGLCPVPDEPTPAGGGSGAGRAFSVQRYGMLQWGDLFTARQKVGLVMLGNSVQRYPMEARSAIRTSASVVINRTADYNSANCRWVSHGEFIGNTFTRQALPIIWDFAEVNLVASSTGSLVGAIDWVATVIESCFKSDIGQIQPADATQHPLPDQAAGVWFTDPPYYDAIPYADLSDFFFVWLKRALPDHPLLRDPFDPANPLSPKDREAVQDETKQCDNRVKDRVFFEDTMGDSFAEGRRVLSEDGIGSVVFAHKTTEGWESLLSGIIRGGWTITGSWPIVTEMGSRLRARDSAALATSVHLICRPRPDDAPVGDWGEVLRKLPIRVGDWMERLQGEGVRGADLVFACIGPALEIFSRYRVVETVEGREVGLPEYLEKVWEVVGRTALEQVLGTAEAKARNGAAGAVEEDARLTALFLWTLQATNGQNGVNGGSGKDGEADSGDLPVQRQTGEDDDEAAPKGRTKGYSLVFDVVRRFAQPLGIELPKWEGRIVETKKGVVRLMAVSERAKPLFGDDGAKAVADWIERDPRNNLQQMLFPEMEKAHLPKARNRSRRGKAVMDPDDAELVGERQATTLDRVHAAMLLQAGGRTNALRNLLKAEQERGPDFLRLANALSALYPSPSEEKRLLDAMLLAVPR